MIRCDQKVSHKVNHGFILLNPFFLIKEKNYEYHLISDYKECQDFDFLVSLSRENKTDKCTLNLVLNL